MAIVGGRNPVTHGICEALGLKNVVNLDISMHLSDVVRVTVDYYPESEDLQEIIPVLTHAKYKLVPDTE